VIGEDSLDIAPILDHRPDLGADYARWPTSCWAA
jgi:hypothetical protein